MSIIDVVPLIAPGLRRIAAAVVIGAVIVLAALALVVAHRRSTEFDTWVYGVLLPRIGNRTQWRLMDSTHPALITAVIAAVALAALIARRWRLLLLCVVTPPVAIGLTELVLKPLVGRQVSGVVTISGSYPSGHETAVATAALLVMVALGQLRIPLRWRLALAVVPLAWMAVAAVALVRGLFHYATDTIGAVCVAATVVIGAALAVDAATAARRVTERPRAAEPAPR